MMRGWGWPDWQIEEALPRVLAACVDVGILQRVGDGFEPTALVQDDAAWERLWNLLGKDERGKGAAG